MCYTFIPKMKASYFALLFKTRNMRVILLSIDSLGVPKQIPCLHFSGLTPYLYRKPIFQVFFSDISSNSFSLVSFTRKSTSAYSYSLSLIDCRSILLEKLGLFSIFLIGYDIRIMIGCAWKYGLCFQDSMTKGKRSCSGQVCLRTLPQPLLH